MKILYATDGFEPSEHAERLLRRTTAPGRHDITVMSVTHAGLPAPEHAVLMLDPIEKRREDTARLVEAAAARLSEAGYRVTTSEAEGTPGEELVAAAGAEGHDLVVVGAGRRTWLGARLLGSVSSYVLHNSPSSVLVVHSCREGSGKVRAVVGADGSDDSRIAIQTMLELSGPDLVAFDVVTSAHDPADQVFAAPGSLGVPIQASQVMDELRDKALKEAQAACEGVCGELRSAGYEATARVVVGPPAQQLLAAAEQSEADLVVVGSRGMGPVRRTLLGSVSDQVVRHATATLVGRRGR